MRTPALLLPCLALLVALPVAAKKIYKYTDANGQVHYTDQKPQGQVDVTEAVVTNVESRNIADLRVEGSGEVREAHVFNQIAGPVQISVGMTESSNVVSDP